MHKLSVKELQAKVAFDSLIELMRDQPILWIAAESYESIADYWHGIDAGIKSTVGISWLDGFHEWVCMNLGTNSCNHWSKILEFKYYPNKPNSTLSEVFELYDSFTIVREAMSVKDIQRKLDREEFIRKPPFLCEEECYFPELY